MRSSILSGAIVTIMLLGLAQTVRSSDDEPDRAADRAAVQARSQEFLKALAKGDAREAASFWTPTGEYAHGPDLTIRGRSNIEKAYAEHFKKKQPGVISIEGDAVRFLADDTAVQEGVFVVRRPNPAESMRVHFSALCVRSNGHWHFGLLRESLETASLQELAWLVGTWSFTSDEAETRMSVEWAENKKFLLCRTTRKSDDQTMTATQILAVHPATHAIQSWTFETDGSLGEAVWSRTDKGWMAKVSSYTADGDKVSATTHLTPTDENSFTFQLTDRTVDGERVADVGPFKVSRAPAGK
jgi:uncharacterized protein (TIGR02246 family)